jgi:hypothetical protein
MSDHQQQFGRRRHPSDQGNRCACIGSELSNKKDTPVFHD